MATAVRVTEPSREEVIGRIADQSLTAFGVIAEAAAARVGGRTASTGSFAAVNEFNAASAVANLSRIQHDEVAACRQLCDEPAIARLVVLDEDDRQETLYISRGTSVPCAVSLCSSLSAKGRLAELPVGAGEMIVLPAGSRYYEVLERTLFRPVRRAGDWDACDTVLQTAAIGPVSIASLRDLLSRAGWSENELDLLERQLAEEDEATNVHEGVRRAMLTAMGLRDQPILDRIQGEIFRLPIDRQLAIMGPAGTGKTTTLVRRLRQKIDAEHLTLDERDLVAQAAESGMPHAQSWLMFTPTELLKHYVREAFQREGVPAPDSRIRTWDEHRHELARRSLPILKSSRGGTLVLTNAALLPDATVTDQTAWFDDFDGFQAALFGSQLREQAAVLAGSADPDAAQLGGRVASLLASASGRPLAAMGALAGAADDLRRLATRLGDSVGEQLRRALAQHLRRDEVMLTDLGRFLLGLATDEDEDEEVEADADAEGDEDEPMTPGGRKAAQAAFLRAVRAAAVARARSRAAPTRGRTGAVLQWIRERNVVLPELKPIGELVAVQRAARRLVGAPAAFLRGVPGRYRAFRRDRHVEGRWYPMLPARAAEVAPLEIDLVLLAMLRNARLLRNDGTLMRRLGERAPAILADVARLERNQILVDEATDFSPVQLACMRSLASGWTDSFLACGDFNQRLTAWGSRSADELAWVSPGIEIREIDVGYRQSRRLNELATCLAATGDRTAETRAPVHVDNLGVPPVLGRDLGDHDRLVAWLAARIGEIDDAIGQLPTVAVLVHDAVAMWALTAGLNTALAPRNLRAVACPGGQALGPGNDVRVFEIEHIKGLEFEAVFFVGVDEVERRSPDLFARYLYVGATRAATYLGITCSNDTAPASLASVGGLFASDWRQLA